MPKTSSTSRARLEPEAQPRPRDERHEAPDDTAPDTVLVTWSAVFPLSHGLGHRVRRHVGWDANAESVAAIAADYRQELSKQVPSPGRVDADGDLIGPADFDGIPQDVLFTAVFNTDLDMIVQRHLPPDVARADS